MPEFDDKGCVYMKGKKYCASTLRSPFTSTISTVEFNCESKQYKTISVKSFRGNMGTGTLLGTTQINGVHKTMPETDMMQWQGLACTGFPARYRPR